MKNISCIDLYCGVGGLTAGLQAAGVNVLAGFDIDESCKWSYEKNTKASFFTSDLSQIDSSELENIFTEGSIRLLAGCAPCQPFSSYGRTRKGVDSRWKLLESFQQLIEDIQPELVTMENVPGLASHSIFESFVRTLKKYKYDVVWDVLKCEEYGVPQRRRRLVLIASKIGKAKLPTPNIEVHKSVLETIGDLPAINAGSADSVDSLHVAASLSPLNLKRIEHSVPGGTWRDWPTELVAECHKKKKGKSYVSVYGRMKWDEPSPTITTQCFGFGNGRFGHPVQNRAITLREAALLQSFPESWEFLPPSEPVQFTSIGRAIGNAVPPKLGEEIGKALFKIIQ